MVDGIGFNLESLAALAPNKRQPVIWGFEADIDFSSLAVKVLYGFFFQYEAVLSTGRESVV